MRWTFRIGFLLLIAWAAYMASPFVALFRLAKAVEARDLAAIEERVDFNALRLSLTRQIVSEYLRSTGRGAELGAFGRNAATGAAVTIADPIVARFVTPDALDRLMRGALPAQIGGAGESEGLRLDLTSIDQAWRTFIQSESRGFANILVPVPYDRPVAEQYRLHLRFKNLSWRLRGVELPAPVVQDLAKRLPRSTS